jgi:hypothetical protein
VVEQLAKFLELVFEIPEILVELGVDEVGIILDASVQVIELGVNESGIGKHEMIPFE